MPTFCEPEEVTLPLASQPYPATIRTTVVTLPPSDAMKLSLPPSRIVLTGFMGAGKSTVGRLLAERLGWRFFDADDAIVTKAGMPVAEIFAKCGEFVFRRMETSAIAHLLGERQAVIALGGGAVEVLANRLLLEQTPHTAVAFLDAPLNTLLARCHAQTDAAIRPNLPLAEERFRYRIPLYRRVARLRVETAQQTPQHTAEEVLVRLGLAASPAESFV